VNTKDRIIQEIETASSDLRKEVLDFILSCYRQYIALS
jgi:hypothetical protein